MQMIFCFIMFLFVNLRMLLSLKKKRKISKNVFKMSHIRIKIANKKGNFLVGQYKKKEEEEGEIRVFKPQILLSSLSNALFELCYHPSLNFYAIP